MLLKDEERLCGRSRLADKGKDGPSRALKAHEKKMVSYNYFIEKKLLTETRKPKNIYRNKLM